MTITTRGSETVVSLLNFCIAILNVNVVEVPQGKEVFGTVSAILALVRDTMIDDEHAIRLTEYCFNACETLKGTLHGKNPCDLSQSEKMGVQNLDRVMRRVECDLRRGATSTPHTGYNKVEGYMQSVRQVLGALHTSRQFLGKDYSGDERIKTTACGRLLRRKFALRELPSIIDSILSSSSEGETIRCLPVGDAQAFIDAVDEALHAPGLSSGTQNKCLKLLYRTCGRHTLLPGALRASVCYDKTSNALYRGGYADVWKGKLHGQDVAVKVIRTSSNDDSRKIINRFYKEVVMWRFLRHPNVLSLIGASISETQFAMASEWMPNGNINQFIKTHPEVNRLGLLVGVAKGLIYLHVNGLVHGDLKGANILIDETCQARLADFGLLTIISDPANVLSSGSYGQGGTVRWMSPELIDPEHFGFDKSRPTKASDCYALGMVVYEIVSGKLPFRGYKNFTVSFKVVKGERPHREAKFGESLWKMLELCWAPDPDDRPSVEDVLQCLETVSNLPESSVQGGFIFEECLSGVFTENTYSFLYSCSHLTND